MNVKKASDDRIIIGTHLFNHHQIILTYYSIIIAAHSESEHFLFYCVQQGSGSSFALIAIAGKGHSKTE